MTSNKITEAFQTLQNFLSIKFSRTKGVQLEQIKYDATFAADNNEPYHCEHTTLHNTEYIQLTL